MVWLKTGDVHEHAVRGWSGEYGKSGLHASKCFWSGEDKPWIEVERRVIADEQKTSTECSVKCT